ncbi:MAG TPA: hypothetical protein DCZ59_08655 [Bacteroidetes bacterium]|nr:hypothetical protein [Bacteroidota bacterium]
MPKRITTTPTEPAVSGHGIRLYLAAARWRAHVDAVYREAGLSPLQVNVLLAVQTLQRTVGSAKQVHVANYAGVDVMTLSKNVRVLEDEKLIRRVADPADSRARLVELTRDGAARLKKVEKGLEKADRDIFTDGKSMGAFERTISMVITNTR